MGGGDIILFNLSQGWDSGWPCGHWTAPLNISLSMLRKADGNWSSATLRRPNGSLFVIKTVHSVSVNCLHERSACTKRKS